MRRILITNDDGIDAEGMQRLVEASKEFGEVWVAAPDGQRSATGHSISLRHSIDVYPAEYPVAEVKAFSCSGSPADCVRVACHFLMPEMPDVVLAGINFGYNSATDIQYSGTCGAAFEAAFQGVHAIAVSEAANGVHEVTDRYLKEVLGELLEKPLPNGVIHNVNFPGCSLQECAGILRDVSVSRSMFYRDGYKEMEKLPGGGSRVKVDGHYNEDCEEGTDMWALVNHYVSVGLVNNVGVRM
ncbi:MAG: 5'/3'-nucleotidase SurE [Eubacterium sp.]|nr:5'/3'-nucleotidase SurE [Eubacterium sp.]